MTNNFWNYTLNYYNEPNQENIKICFDLRVLFKNYYELVKIVFAKKDDKFTIKNEANIFLENDEFAFILDQIIKKFINDRKDLTDIEKLAFITKYNPYYIPGEYSNRIIDSEIFRFRNI